MAQRRASARAARSRKAKSTTTTRVAASSKAAPAPSPADQTVDHAEHHQLIAQNLNGLLENFTEMRAEWRAEMRVLKREIAALHKKFEQVDIDLPDVRGRLETVTSATYDSDQTLRGVLKHVEALWGTAIEIAGDKAATVKKQMADIEEEIRHSGSEMERRLADLSGPTDTKK
ncbi:MAG: hypothetical protein QF573_09680 [Chloroflexota bacterium]|nr:hypothetical protein [Chloroflexota bacterium]